MTVSIHAALTLEQFCALPEREPDGTHYELSDGELVSLSPAGYRHGVIVSNITRLIGNAIDRKRFIVSSGEAGFLLSSKEDSARVRGADVAVSRREDIGDRAPVGWQTRAPVLAVEVVSPSNEAADLDRKVAQYLDAGTAEVWLAYPDSQRVYFFSNGQQDCRIFEESDRFRSILGLEFQVASFFEL